MPFIVKVQKDLRIDVETSAQAYGPFEKQKEAELFVIALAVRDDIRSAKIIEVEE